MRTPTAPPSVPAAARVSLREQGWTLLRGQRFLGEDGLPDPRRVLAFARAFGQPSARDGGLWRVTPAGGATFSTSEGPVPPHTDAAYRAVPEAGLCLFAVRVAGDGGRTILLDPVRTVRELPSRLRDRLRSADWSWRTPSPFAPEPPFSAAVLTGAAIRWRPDLLTAPRDAVQREAARELAARLAVDPETRTLALTPGDVLIVDNRRILHGRTGFTDPSRLLLRVRLRTLG